MQKVFADSDCLIDVLRGRPHARQLMEKIRKREVAVAVSSITAFELYCGALLSSNSEKKLAEAESLLEWLDVVPVGKEIMSDAAKIFAELRKKGTMIELQDIFIAASCLSMGLPFLTRNKKHFERVEGMKFVTV